MKKKSITASSLGLVLLVAAGAAHVAGQLAPAPQMKVANAKPGEFRLIASNGIREPLDAVRAEAEKAVGHPFVIEFGASMGLKATIASGQAFEVAIVTPVVINDMIAAGKIVPGSGFEVGRAPIGIGQRGDAPKQDISTAAALKQTLLKATSIRFAANGAALPSINKMRTGLDIAEAFNSKANLPAGSVHLMPGEYELTIYPASEIPKQWVYLGQLPKEYDVPAVMMAGIGVGGDQKEAKALIEFLKGPAIDPFLKESRMQR